MVHSLGVVVNLNFHLIDNSLGIPRLHRRQESLGDPASLVV